jgi:hypothetical protein
VNVKVLKKLLVAIGVMVVGFFVLVVIIAVTHPNATPTAQSQPAPPAAPTAPPPTAPANDNWGKDFVRMIGYPIGDNLTVKQCSRGEGQVVHCRVHLAKGKEEWTGVSGYLFTAKAVKFEDHNVVDLPGAIAEVPDIRPGHDAEITLIVPAGTEMFELIYN